MTRLHILPLAAMTLPQYMQCLEQGHFPGLMHASLPADASLRRHIRRLLRSKGITLWRMPDVRFVAAFFCEQIIGQQVRLHFPMHVPENAYMTDDGQIVISQLFLYRSGGERVLRILLHELVHWWLSRQTHYPLLLQLNQSYLAACAQMADSAVLSPVELAATVLSSEMLTALAASAEPPERSTLTDMGQKELNKVNAAINTLCLYTHGEEVPQ